MNTKFISKILFIVGVLTLSVSAVTVLAKSCSYTKSCSSSNVYICTGSKCATATFSASATYTETGCDACTLPGPKGTRGGGYCDNNWDGSECTSLTSEAEGEVVGDASAIINEGVRSASWNLSCGNTHSYSISSLAGNGSCGSATTGTYSSTTPPSANLCNNGTASAVTPNGAISKYTWKCNGVGSGSNASCSANMQTELGICGSSNDLTLLTAPTENLCGSGYNSVVATTSSAFTWTCYGTNGTSSQSCLAHRQAACGVANGKLATTTPSASTLCGVGNASSITTTGGQYTWSCTNTGVNNVASCSAPAQSLCGTKNNTKIAAGSNIIPTTPNICAAENSIFGAIGVNYANGTWTWACKNVTQPPQVYCSAQCASTPTQTYYCENSNTCSTTCTDWCDDDVEGNPLGNQNVKKSFVSIGSNGSCGIAQIDKFYLRPAIADKNNKCYAFWSIKTLNAGTSASCGIDGTSVASCNNTSTGYAVDPGEHTFKTTVSIDNDGNGTMDYSLSEQEKVKCVPNPAHTEV